jgi:hypothetical protein
MSIADEIIGNNGLSQALQTGLQTLSQNQVLTFSQYTKQTITQDGYVFWVANGTTMQVQGSLHYGTERDQSEDQTIGINSIIFTAEAEVTQFNVPSYETLWICDYTGDSGATIQIAFSSRGPFYQQSNLYHYAGFAVYPALSSQLVASASDLPSGPIVSNSLPIFLAAASQLPKIPASQAPTVQLYPSFLVPDNLVPPYGVVHVEPGLTDPLQAFPHYRWSERTGTGPYPLPSTQLMRDRVRITLYGLNNQQALQWLSGLILYSRYTDDFGFMSSPAIQDEKRVQPEISALAMKKTISFDASYYQGAADAIARQLILSASIAFTDTTN